MIIFYQLFLFFYKSAIAIVSLGNPKARKWINGRKEIFAQVKTGLKHAPSGKRIWMHCASLGEFEQGKPVLQKLQQQYPQAVIIISFFSPSGYEIARKKKEFDHIFYLPMDGASNAKRWMHLVDPQLILWVKYEYWHYYLLEAMRRKIPLLMVSGVYRPQQIFFKWYGGFYRNMLKSFTHFFVQNGHSKLNLQKIIHEQKITISGDTRCDRVISIAENFYEVPRLKEFCGAGPVIVAGSTWEDDEAEWTHFLRAQPGVRFIIAPHEIDRENLEHVRKHFAGSVFYSEWLADVQQKKETNCLIIDNIGMLSRLYNYATITYVGGGFGDDGLHNILEAAVYGKPVIFGPEHDKNFEAQELIDCSGAIEIKNAVELEEVLNRLLNNKEELSSRGAAAKNYVYKNAGASQKILEFIHEKIAF